MSFRAPSPALNIPLIMSSCVLQDSMSPAQREAYEESKFKMRKAIADPDLIDETEQVHQWRAYLSLLVVAVASWRCTIECGRTLNTR